MSFFLNAYLYGVLSVAIGGLLLHFFRDRISAKVLFGLWVLLALRMLLPIPAPWPEIPLASWVAPAIVCVWLGLAAIQLIRLVFRTKLLRALIIQSESEPDEILHQEFLRARKAIQLNGRPALVSSSAEFVPLLSGWMQPLVALPDKLLAEARPEMVRMILIHELTHLKRHDLLWTYLFCFVAALNWFNPLFAMFVRDFNTARELACDSDVLAALPEDQEDYGHCLLYVASAMQNINPKLAVAGITEENSIMKKRITRIVEPVRGYFAPLTVFLLFYLASLLPGTLLHSAETAPDWRIVQEQKANAEQLKAMQQKFPAITTQTARIISYKGEQFSIVVTEFKTVKDAEGYWNFRQQNTMTLHLQNGKKHFEIYTKSVNIMAWVWADFKPDPAIRNMALLASNGVEFSKINLMLDPMLSQFSSKLGTTPLAWYNAISNYGQLNYIWFDKNKFTAETMRDKLIQLGGKAENVIILSPELLLEFIPYGTDFQQNLRELLKKTPPEKFCPEFIF